MWKFWKNIFPKLAKKLELSDSVSSISDSLFFYKKKLLRNVVNFFHNFGYFLEAFLIDTTTLEKDQKPIGNI